MNLELNFSLNPYDLKIKELDEVIHSSEEEMLLIQQEIEAYKLKVAELQGRRADLIKQISNAKDDKHKTSLRRERDLQERLMDEELSKTAQKIQEILHNFEAWGKARDYQKEDITTCIHAYLSGARGFLNANDMALGKTFETLVSLKVLEVLFRSEYERSPKILWLTKSAILETGGTVREANKWYPGFKFVSVSGSMPAKQREMMFTLLGDLEAGVITNYESVRTTEALRNQQWDFIIMDEVHKLKGGANLSGPTQVWKAVKEITENARMIVMLSGTPMVNRGAEMWSYLHIFDPERFPSVRRFEEIFTTFKGGEYIIDADKLLQNALKGRMVRRTKKEVGIQVPEVTPEDQRTKMLQMLPKQREVYDQMVDQFYIWLDGMAEDEFLPATSILAQLTRTRQINLWPVIDFKRTNPETGEETHYHLDVRESSKIDEFMEDLDSIGNENYVLFCTFNEPMKEVQRRVRESGRTCEILSSETKDLSQLEVGFQQNKIQVLCINSAMGEGLNLQKSDDWPGGASYVGLLDKWWNPARNDQCIDRVVRPGATILEPVTVTYYENENSVDQFINALIEKKRAEFSGVMDDDRLRPSEWKKLMKEFIKK